MGCCFSNDEDKDNQDPQVPDERTRLLPSPVGGDGPSGPVPRPEVTQTQKGDEQSALNRILHQTANEVIDVAALDTQVMEQHEYQDRARQYNIYLANAFANFPRIQSQPPLPSGVAAPQVLLASQPVSLTDIQLITTAAQQCSKAVKEIKVRHKEDLVVPFGVP